MGAQHLEKEQIWEGFHSLPLKGWDPVLVGDDGACPTAWQRHSLKHHTSRTQVGGGLPSEVLHCRTHWKSASGGGALGSHTQAWGEAVQGLVPHASRDKKKTRRKSPLPPVSLQHPVKWC